jgi:hypothetical protein
MRPGHFVTRIILNTATICLLTASMSFGFSFGSDDRGKSGLDLNRGYDINTVTTVTGRVAALPQTGDRGGVTIAIISNSETVHLYVGPNSYWDKKGIPVRLNEDISAKGSKSQGKDGRTYLLAQRIVNRTTGAQVNLRNEKGEPGWLGADTTDHTPAASQGGGMMRGGSMMRSGGGGGMMRR